MTARSAGGRRPGCCTRRGRGPNCPRWRLLTGRCDVVHATNFVLPPLRRARGVVTVHDLSYLRVPDTVSAASARYRELVPRSLRRAPSC